MKCRWCNDDPIMVATAPSLILSGNDSPETRARAAAMAMQAALSTPCRKCGCYPGGLNIGRPDGSAWSLYVNPDGSVWVETYPVPNSGEMSTRVEIVPPGKAQRFATPPFGKRDAAPGEVGGG